MYIRKELGDMPKKIKSRRNMEYQKNFGLRNVGMKPVFYNNYSDSLGIALVLDRQTNINKCIRESLVLIYPVVVVAACCCKCFPPSRG